MAQVIKKYIFLSGAKSNDPLHTDYVPNVFKFTKMNPKITQTARTALKTSKETKHNN